jgi:tetratricopeptide (TPR) repeat protein
MEREQLLHRAFAALLLAISFIVYLITIAPTTSFWDCGEFITCAYILGVPHPPGAQFYLLLGRIFTLIPWAADIGLRVNIISAITTALTVMFTYLIIARLINLWRGKVRTIEDRIILYGSSIIGALAFAFSDSLWFNAVEAEVYAISMFFTAIIVWLILVWHEKADDPSSDKYILLIAYFIGLAIGVHLLNILALPTIFLIYYFRRHSINLKSLLILVAIGFVVFMGIYPGIVKWLPNLVLIFKIHYGTIFSAAFFITLAMVIIGGIFFAIHNRSRIVFVALTSLLLIFVGASTFPSVYFRSKLNPAIDENDPENLENLVSYINREQYGDWSIIERRAPLWEYQIKKMYLRYLGWQYIGKGTRIGADGFLADTISPRGLWGIPFLIGILGMIHHFFKDHRRALAIFLLFIMTGLAIVIYLNQPDPQPRERDYVYVASFFAFAIWIGIGGAGILESVVDSIQKNTFIRKLIMLIALGLLFVFIPINMLAGNYHSHDRSGNYVAFDYSYNLLQSCEKDGILFTNGDNDTFPLWFLQYVYKIRQDVRVVNLSLLNTHWYIKQLRDQEPRVPIHLTDTQVNRLTPTYWPESKIVKISVPRDVYQKELEDLDQRKEFVAKALTNPPEITFELSPTYMGQAIRVQDLMILNIIASNRFKKPIYFAVTVSNENMLNMDDYLRMDGLVYKLITYPGERISPSRLQANLFNKFRYRNLNNPDIFLDDDIIGLLNNYRSGFLRLADFYRKEKMYKEMFATLDKMEESIPETVIPVHDRRFSFGVGDMYREGGRPEEFEKRLEYWLNQPNTTIEDKFQYAQFYHQLLRNYTRAEEIILDLINQNPKYLKGYYWLFNLYSEINAYDKGINLAKELLNINPNDKQAKFWLNQFEKLSSEDISY